MRIKYLQHVPYEGPGNLENWARERGHSVDGVRLYDSDHAPLRPGQHDDYDWLVVLGGPMSVYNAPSWMDNEKALIRDTIRDGKLVLGICLGAQLLADVLGADVHPNENREIGWFPVSLTSAGTESGLFDGFPPEFVAFHWHGDTFEIPEGADRLCRTNACRNQAFVRDNAIGLQFHLESTIEAIKGLCDASNPDHDEPYVQSRNALQQERLVNRTRHYLETFLDNASKRHS